MSTPMTGWAMTVPKDEMVALDMTIEEAMRFVVRAGVISPEAERAAVSRKA